VDPIPVNFQNPGWTDRFKVYVNKGSSFVVERVDHHSGWGQDLVLRVTVKDDEGKSGGGGGKAAWTQVEGAATSIGIDDWGNMICCNAAGQIYEKNHNEMAWRLIDGAATMVARGRDGSTWCVNSAQNIWRRDGAKWTQAPGAAVFVSVGSADQVIVINAAQQIFKWNRGGNSWAQFDGAAVRGSIGADGTLFVVNAGGEVFRRDIAWTKLTNCNAGTVAVVSRELVYLSNRANQIYKSKDGGGNWKQMEGALTHTAASKGHFVGCNAAQQLWHMKT